MSKEKQPQKTFTAKEVLDQIERAGLSPTQPSPAGKAENNPQIELSRKKYEDFKNYWNGDKYRGMLYGHAFFKFFELKKMVKTRPDLEQLTKLESTRAHVFIGQNFRFIGNPQGDQVSA